MRINFFEEYPTQENLEKAKLIDFDSTIFLATHSITEFKEVQKQLASINPKVSTAYWPILKNSYWISPFSNTKDLQDFVDEIFSINEPLTILIDLELPLGKHKELYFKNFFSIWKNKRILKRFFTDALNHNIKIVTAEYPPFFLGATWIYRMLGISLHQKKYGHIQCIMYYTSMSPNKIILNWTAHGVLRVRRYNPELQLGLGTIATGVMGNEPILSPESLERDLKFMSENEIKTGIVFRLGGLSSEYIQIVKEFIS